MAKLVDHGIVYLQAPQALGGFLVDILVLSPEGLGAAKAAIELICQLIVPLACFSTSNRLALKAFQEVHIWLQYSSKSGAEQADANSVNVAQTLPGKRRSCLRQNDHTILILCLNNGLPRGCDPHFCDNFFLELHPFGKSTRDRFEPRRVAITQA